MPESSKAQAGTATVHSRRVAGAPAPAKQRGRDRERESVTNWASSLNGEADSAPIIMLGIIGSPIGYLDASPWSP
jgi:hypothetical protein